MNLITPLTKGIENSCFDWSTRNVVKSSHELVTQDLPSIGSPSAKILVLLNASEACSTESVV
jgi:hypothetical protein